MGGWTGRGKDRIIWDGVISINGVPVEPQDLTTKAYVDSNAFWQRVADVLSPKVAADVDLGDNSLKFGAQTSIEHGTGFDTNDLRLTSIKATVLVSDTDGTPHELIWDEAGFLYSTTPTALGRSGDPWGTTFITTIDLGTNTITDGVMTGDWNLGSGNLTTSGKGEFGDLSVTQANAPDDTSITVSPFTVTGGDGGDESSPGTSNGGDAGNISITLGKGGDVSAGPSSGGDGGSYTITAGDGGASGSVGDAIGGDGGNINLIAGARGGAGSRAGVTGAVIVKSDLSFSNSSSGLLFGEIYARDNTTTTSTSTTKTQILIFDTNGESNGMTTTNSQGHMIVIKSGKYKIDCSISIKNSSGSAHVIALEMYKNNGATVFDNIHAGRTLGTGTDVGNLTMSGIVDVVANDTLELWITSDSGAARTVTIEDIDFCAIMIGG